MSYIPSSDEMFGLIRSFGYTTRDQTDEIVDAISSRWGTPQLVVRDDTELIRQMRIALTDLAGLYNTDEGCRNLLAYKTAVKAITAARARLENT